jgi:hypothetical protein
MKHAQRSNYHLRTINVVTSCLLGFSACPALADGELMTSGGPEVPPNSCIYYEHIDFDGHSVHIPLGIRRKYVGDDWNDEISSIACANGCRLLVWEHRDFVGASRTFAENGAHQYVGDDWNDSISSMKVACD